ncbi:hypothetical protein MBLNU457_6142t1 [Dothideomycetes sp. NU457]
MMDARPDEGRVPLLQARVPRFQKVTRRATSITDRFNVLKLWPKWAEMHAHTQELKAKNDKAKAKAKANMLAAAQAVLAEEPEADEPETEISAEPSIESTAPLTQESASRLRSGHASESL